MNIVTKLTATLVASLVITACSSGSSGSATKSNDQKAKTDIPAPKVERSKEAAPQMDNSKVGQPKEVVQKVANSAADKPKEVISQSQVDLSQKDALKPEELNKNKSNTDILKELEVKDIKTGIISRPDIVLSLALDGKENVQIILSESDITRNSLKITNTIPTQEIKTLKDASNKLLGYYGHMKFSQVKQDERYGTDSAHLYSHYLLSMNEEEKVRPITSIIYKGNMLYSYNDDSQMLQATVQATYRDEAKTLSMEVFGDRGDYWKLGEAGRYRLESRKLKEVSVSEDGTIVNAMLYSKIDGSPLKLAPDANFSGGIFGKNGEVLAGSAISEKWQGVIGATATENKK